MKKYPFKFLDSYEREDRGIFFGRDEEINALYEMVFQSSVILVYGASGTGKTSLINCGLAGKFQPHDWLALMIRRGNNINDSLEKVLNDAGGNMSTIQVDTGWHDEWSDESETTTAALSPVARSIKAVYDKSFRPVYLIFDQFEELFILGSVKEQELFIGTVQAILQSEQPVKLIFCIREEYLGYLFEFERAVPQLLRKKIRIEPMNLEKVKQVIIGAAEYEDSNIRLKPGESVQIAEGIFDKIKGKGKSLTIQLPFLQVFLDKFYMKITKDESREADAEFSLQKLNDMGEIGDVLINFLEEQVAGISKKFKDKYPALTPETTWKILSPFSTLEGTREPISKKDLYDRLQNYDTVMIDDVVDAFISSRIIRYNEATDMFEIAHDALARPIAEKRSVEETALLEIKRLIKSQVAVKEEAREYFTEKQLLFIEPYMEKFKQSEEERDWIAKSRVYVQEQKESEKKKEQEELAKTKKRLRTVYGLLGLALIAIIAAGYFEIIANKAKNEAERQTGIAKQALIVAGIARDSAIMLRQLVDSNSRIVSDILFGSGNQNNPDSNMQNSSPSIIALSRAYTEYKAGAKAIPLNTNGGPFVSKYLQSARVSDDSDWNVAFVTWCFTYNDAMKSRFSDFRNAKYPPDFLSLLAAKGYVVNSPPEKQMPGDIVFFNFGENKGAQTCGIVFNTDINKGFVYSIEGNIGGKVQTVTRYLNDVLSYARIPVTRIYILAGNNNKTVLFDTLQKQLLASGFNVLGAKYLNDNGRPDSPEIRYFNASDKDEAEKIAKFMQLKMPGQVYVPKQYQANTAKPGYIEIWLGR